jgi:RNA recognition motif-containing protein
MSTKRLFVGNLPFSTTADELRQTFSAHGTVHDVSLVSDRETGRSRGFAFVDMDAQGAQAAITALNSKEFNGRELRVDEAHAKGGGGGGRF